MASPPTFLTNAVAWAKDVHEYLIALCKWLKYLQKLLAKIDWKRLEQEFPAGPGAEVPKPPPDYP